MTQTQLKSSKKHIVVRIKGIHQHLEYIAIFVSRFNKRQSGLMDAYGKATFSYYWLTLL